MFPNKKNNPLILGKYLSIAVDHSTVPPTLLLNGSKRDWHEVATMERSVRNRVRARLATFINGNKLVAYTMSGSVLPSR